jgi:hypothetical protein
MHTTGKLTLILKSSIAEEMNARIKIPLEADRRFEKHLT